MINPRNPIYEKPYRNYIRVDVYKAGVSVVGTISKARGRIDATITWQETLEDKDLTAKQAGEYLSALLKISDWAVRNGANGQGDFWTPGKVFEADNATYVKRFMFHDDVTRFIQVSRRSLGFGMFSKPVYSIDGGAGDVVMARQAATTLQQCIRDAAAWR